MVFPAIIFRGGVTPGFLNMFLKRVPRVSSSLGRLGLGEGVGRPSLLKISAVAEREGGS